MTKKNYLIMALMICLSGFVFWSQAKDIPLESLIETIQDFHPQYLLLGFGFMILAYLCEAMTLKILEEKNGQSELDNYGFVRVPLIQSLFNAITPMSSGGQPAQLMALVQMGVEGGRATSILLMKLIIFQLVVLFYYIGTFLIGFKTVATTFGGLAIVIFVGFTMHILTIIFLLMMMFKREWTLKIIERIFKFMSKHSKSPKIARWRDNTVEKVENFYHEGQRLKKQKKKLVQASVLTFFQMLFYYSIPYFVLLTFGVQANYFELIALNIMISMIIAVIPIPGGTGGAEYSFQMLFSTFISSPIILVISMFVWRFITYYFGMFCGLIALAKKPKKSIINKEHS